MALYRFRQFNLTGGSKAESVVAGAVGADFFDVVRTPPALGRVFLAEEDSPAKSHVVVISDGFWKTHMGSAPDAVGRTLRLNDEAYTIVGVMPARFTSPSWGIASLEMWVPIAYTDTERAVRDNHNDSVIARLRPGVSMQQAQSEMDLISKRLEQAYPQANGGWGAVVVPLQELIVGDVRTSLVMLLAAVALVLLIACANVGNLLFARALARRKELAIRAALGAGRARVFQQVLIEALVLAAAGGVVGLLVARTGLSAAATLLADQVPRANEISIDARVVIFVVGVSILTGILAGGLPALRAGRSDLNDALKEGGRNDSAVGVRTRRALIVCEVALSLVLLMAAGVMLRSLTALRHVDAGYDPRNVLTMGVALPKTQVQDRRGDEGILRPRAGTHARAARRRVRFAGRRSAVAGRLGPADRSRRTCRAAVTRSADRRRPPHRAGVLADDEDSAGARARRRDERRQRPARQPSGRQAAVGRHGSDRPPRDAAARGQAADQQAGRRHRRRRQTGGAGGRADADGVRVLERFSPGNLTFTFVLRTLVPPSSVAQAATGVVRTIDPEQPVERVMPMQEVLDSTLTSQRFSALLLALFAAVALTLASVGIYSVLSYIVRGRSREIGIRTALGARTGDVLRLVVIEGMTPAVIGIIAGAIAALGASRLLNRLVFGVSASDPLTLAVVAGLLGLVALLASLVPAYRASRLDPLTVLRGD